MHGRTEGEGPLMFHVPESARDTTHPQLGSTPADGNNGAFYLESPEPGWRLMLICSDSSEDRALAQWEHVSIHAYKGKLRTLRQRTPTWKEMSYVKRLCWDAEDIVMQLHPPESEYVNCHPHTLHLWRPIDAVIPTPPAIFVGPPSIKVLT
jgi:hypothetical protein